MSRVSGKSSLSPSASNGSSSINLGKDSGVNLGAKSQTSVSTGGIGVTREVANIGGMSVTTGVAVEILPVGFDISGNPDYKDPTNSSISIGGSAEVPGGILGVGGGITINTSTGAVEEVSIGGEVAGFGINISKSDDGFGFGLSLQVPGTPLEINLGFGFPNDKNKPTPTPTPAPAPAPTPTPTRFPPQLPLENLIPNNPSPPNFAVGCLVWQKIVRSGPAGWGGMPLEKPIPDGSDWQNYDEIVTSNNFLIYAEPDYYDAQAPNYFVRIYLKPNAPDKIVFSSRFGTRLLPSQDLWDGLQVMTLTSSAYYYRPNSSSGYIAIYTERVFWKRSNNQWELAQEANYSIDSTCKPVLQEKLYPPFPNPPPRKEKMDECCRENLKFLRAIYKGLGIAKFPGQMPSTIIQTIPKKGEQPAEPPLEPVGDWVDLFMWNFKRDDERWGQWEIQIDVKDSDLTKEGDQEKSIKFPNLAESLAEMEGQLLSLLTNVEALVAMQTKCLVESGMARQEAIKGYLASKAIIKYMAFKSTEIDVAVPMTFTPGAESISELVKESEGHIKGTDYTEKETLRDILLDLLQAAAVIRAVHWQRINTKTDTKSQLLGLLKGSVDLANSLTKPTSTTGDTETDKFDPTQNFEDFIDSVEDGFTNSTGITDIQNPYGKSRDRRPRIRQIGDNISQAGGK